MWKYPGKLLPSLCFAIGSCLGVACAEEGPEQVTEPSDGGNDSETVVPEAATQDAASEPTWNGLEGDDDTAVPSTEGSDAAPPRNGVDPVEPSRPDDAGTSTFGPDVEAGPPEPSDDGEPLAPETPDAGRPDDPTEPEPDVTEPPLDASAVSDPVDSGVELPSVDAGSDAGAEVRDAGGSSTGDPPEPDVDAAGDAGEPDDPSILLPGGDEDGDGISNADEQRLGTSALRFDTDDDGQGDGPEVGDVDAPLDGDGDGIVDALEHASFDHDRDGIADPIDPASSWQLVWGGFTPTVVTNDGTTTAQLEVHLTAQGEVTRVRAGVSPNFRHPDWLHYDLTVDGVPIGTLPVELFDDGTHGDRFAGDSVFTRSGFATTASILSSNGLSDYTYVNALHVTEGGVEQEYLLGVTGDADYRVISDSGFGLGVLDPEALVPVDRSQQGLAITSHLLNLVAPELEAEATSALIEDASPDRFALAGAVLSHFTETVDFLYVLPERRVISAVQGVHLAIQNDVQGIGRSITLAPAELAGLDSLIAFNPYTEFPLGHETLHRWGVYLDPAFGFDTAGRHWGQAGTYGVLGGFDPASLVDHGDGTITIDRFAWAGNEWTTTPLSEIELYLMGLVPPEEVAPIPVLFDVEVVDSSDPETVTVSADVSMVSIEDIVAEHGERVPAHPNAQTEFRAAFVVISTHPLTDAELAFVHHHAQRYGQATSDTGMTFAESTGGRATLETGVPELEP